MPRYTAITPQFDPIDYQTRIRPLEQYKEEYDRRTDALDEQAVLADAIGGLIDENREPELADIYKQFSQNLGDTVSNLMETGDLGSSRRALSQLRRDYANQLVPIKTAYEDRAKEAEEYRKKKLADDTYIGTDPMSHSLSDYYKGARPNDKGISGASLYSMAMEDAKTASGREFRETAWRLDKNLGNQFFTKIEREGWTQDEVMAALSLMTGSGNKDISEDARKLMKYIGDTTARIHDLRGVQDLNDAQKIREADGYILEGILSGIGYKQTDDKAAYNPSLWLDYKIKKKQLGEENTDNTTASNTNQEIYVPEGKDSKLISKATSTFTPIINRSTGVTVDNPIDAYKQLHYNDAEEARIKSRIAEIEKGREVIPEPGGYIIRDINVSYLNPDAKIGKRTQRVKNSSLSEEYTKLKKDLEFIDNDNKYRRSLYKNSALSDKEFRSVGDIIGNQNAVSVDNLKTATENILAYATAPVVYNDQVISNNEETSELQKRITADIRNYIKEHPEESFIYETEDGTRKKSGTPKKVSEETFDDSAVSSIEMNPFNLADGFIKVVTKSGKYLIPVSRLRIEAGETAINRPTYERVKRDASGNIMTDKNGNVLYDSVSRKQKANEAIFRNSPTTKTIKERLDDLDNDVWEAVVEIARDYGYNLRTYRTGVEKKNPQ